MKGIKSRMNHPHRRHSHLQRRACVGCSAVSWNECETGGDCQPGGKIRLLLALFCTLAIACGMAGCGSTAATVSQTPLISVEMTQLPPTTMIVGNSTVVSATVSNDPANAGVDWVVTCANAPNCGTFNPSHTFSGLTSIYTAPTSVPAKQIVTVTALSSSDRSKTAVAPVTLTSTITAIVINPVGVSAPADSVVNLGATVVGDPANLGTDWTVTCPTTVGPVTCGSGLHSVAGGTVAFVIPETVTLPGTTQGVSLVGTRITFTAYPTADHSFSCSSVLVGTPCSNTASLPVTAPISISITEAPPTTMLTNATAPVIAVVSNDTAKAGVTWQVACEQTQCGSITPSQTASGVAATFTAPPTVPSPNPAPGLQVAIIASANANPQTIIAHVTVYIVAPISIAITRGVANNTIVQGTGAPLIATVSNDSANAGVDWTVACASVGACGTFSSPHTASGAPTTYTAPSNPPAGATVTITATSTSDPTQSAQQVVTVTNAPPPNSLLQGQFVLYLSARNSKNGPFVLGGAISGDGNGNITAGKFDMADAAGNAVPANGLPIASPSTYSIGADGRGQLQLTLNTFALNSSFGVPAGSYRSTLTLSVVFVSPQHALLTETDTFGNGSGTLDFQNAADLAAFGDGSAGLNGVYSLQLNGSEYSTGFPGFLLAAAIASQASGNTSVFTGYTTDQSAAGAITSVPFTTGSQSFPTAPSPLGEILLPNVNLGLVTPFNIDLWIIDANHFVVTDFIDALSSSPVIIGGYLTAQPASPSLSGTLAFVESGATTAAQPQVVGGIVTCGSTGILDVVPLAGSGLNNQAVSATCSGPSNGRGLIGISGAGSSGVSQLAAYPTLDQGIYLIELDGGSAGTSGPSGAGVAYQQTLPSPIPSSALAGNYGSSFSSSTPTGSEILSGQVVADGSSALSGTVDVNSFDTTAAPPSANPSPGVSLAGSSFTSSDNGRFLLTLTLTPAGGQPTPPVNVLHPACYMVDANTCLLLGLDATAPGTGILQLQSTGL